MSYEYEFYDTPVGDLHPPLSNYETLQNGQREPGHVQRWRRPWLAEWRKSAV